MKIDNTEYRNQIVEKILAAQDSSFRWGCDEKLNRVREDELYYSPKFRSSLWTLVMLAEIQAPKDLPQIPPALKLLRDQFFEPEYGVFRLPGMSHFPIPCLNGNMIYLHQYFQVPESDEIDQAVRFFTIYQRFDDGDFKTPKDYPYYGNQSCYGSHTCYWGAAKIFKGLTFIPSDKRSLEVQNLIGNCIDYILQHEVCFGSRHPDKFLHPDMNKLTFPNFYKSDFLELLWLLAREQIHDSKMNRALDLLRSRMNGDGAWELEKLPNTLVSTGPKNAANVFITERAKEVLEYYGA